MKNILMTSSIADVMSEEYIRNHFADIIKYANVIENRLEDDCCLENVINDNKEMLELAKEYEVNYVLIENEYEDIEKGL